MTVEVYGARVRQARVLRRMRSAEVRDALGWKGSRQTKLEQAATARISQADLDALAALLRFPVKFFVTPAKSRVRVDDLMFHAPKATTQGEKEYLAVFAAVAGDFLEDMDALRSLPPVRLPKLDPDTDVEAAAKLVRARLGYESDEPIGHLTYEVERAGCAVVIRPRHSRSTGETDWRSVDADGPDSDGSERVERHYGYSARVGEFGDRPLVVVRFSEEWERTRWTLAHEVGHLVLHHHGGGITDDKESQASRFASELLAPAAALRKEMPGMPTLLNLLPLKVKWGISLRALLRHMHESRLLDPARFATLQKQLYTRVNPATGRTWGRAEPEAEAWEVERPRLVSRWVERCYGATNAAMLSPRGLMWPKDLVEDFLAGQRSFEDDDHRTPPSPPPQPSGVVDFGRFKAKRRA